MQLEVQAERKRIREEKARVEAMMDDVERRYPKPLPLTLTTLDPSRREEVS